MKGKRAQRDNIGIVTESHADPNGRLKGSIPKRKQMIARVPVTDVPQPVQADPSRLAHHGEVVLEEPGTSDPPEAPQPRHEASTFRQAPGLDDAASSETGHEQQVFPQLTGLIEYATATSIKGWAWDALNPTRRVHLELVEKGVQRAAAVADIERDDLCDIGIGDGRHGFLIELAPGVIRDGEIRVLDLRCTTTGAAVPGSPITVTPSKTPFECCLDSVTDAGVAGWLMVRDDPTRHCVLVLREGGRVLAQAVASLFRRDLLTAGVGDGCYGFNLQMPHSLLDGEEHLLDVIDMHSGFAVTKKPIRWRSTAGTGGEALTGVDTGVTAEGSSSAASASVERAMRTGDDSQRRPYAGAESPKSLTRLVPRVVRDGTLFLFDVSDLIYYIGHHPNLTGIQRVQSSIVLSLVNEHLIPRASAVFLSFNARTRNWVTLPTGFLVSLLQDLFSPEDQRLVSFPTEEARYGVLPGATEFDGTGILDSGNQSVLCLLGAAWVNQDYLHRVLTLKRQFGTRFAMTIHDLIPIYARDTCDQDTARVFEEFMRRALRHVDHVLTVSENTAQDLRRYLGELRLAEPPITVTKNGSSFTELLPRAGHISQVTSLDLPERFVLFVATIEGRKNHRLMFEIWRRMIAGGDDPPHLICVGRLGWRATEFISALVETNYLDGRIQLLREISDADLRLLYSRCLFTVCPTLYEGWGLPVGESLAMGRICVSSDRASVPEVAGDCGVYMNIDSVEDSLRVIRDLIRDGRARKNIEAKIRQEYTPVTWKSVAQRVVAACEQCAGIRWEDSYPYTLLPYSSEISFGRLDRDIDGTGELVLTQIVDARCGHFTDRVLEERSFLLGEEIRSGGSWAQPERWGTWLCHSGGDIVFALAPEASQLFYLFLRLRVCGWLHEQPIRLLANGDELWSGTIGEHSKDVMLRVRKRASAADRWRLRIAAHVELTAELTKQIAENDGRIPTIGFERLIVIPEDDLKTRLDVLSSSLLL
jgi:glycosyltransferase involved in cell wall biosynthesis